MTDICAMVNRYQVVSALGAGRQRRVRNRLWGSAHNKDLKGFLARRNAGQRVLVVLKAQKRQLAVGVGKDVRVLAHKDGVTAVVVVVERYHRKTCILSCLCAKRSILEDPGSCLIGAKTAKGLKVNIGLNLVHSPHIFCRDHCFKEVLNTLSCQSCTNFSHGS